jgi:CRP/FNR family cyclic AMP-dependent transcriptional regulator
MNAHSRDQLERRIQGVLEASSDQFVDLVCTAGLDPKRDLRFGDWHGLDLSGADLRGFDFTGANLSGTCFDDALIFGAVFEQAIYESDSLRRAADFDVYSRALLEKRAGHRRGQGEPARRGTRDEHGDPADADMRSIMRDHYLFAKLTPPQLDRLSACIVTRSVKRGTVICAKGDPGTCLFAIGSGMVQIGVRSVVGKDEVSNVLGSGSIFGEIALLDGHPRTTDAIATADCQLFVIDRRDFVPIMYQEPDIAVKIIEVLCSRLRRTTEQAEEVVFLDLPSRLAKALMRLREEDSSGTYERKISITQKDLGNIIGMSRQSTNRQLRLWEDKKWLRLERNAVVILAPGPLAAIANEDPTG